MKRSASPWVLFLLVVSRGATGQPLPRELAPDVIEGPLIAATCVDSRSIAACNQHALSAGQPGGVVAGRQFTMLLIDGRILARTCAASTKGRLRASGILHRGGFAMSVFRLEQDCGSGWAIVDLPHTGTLADGPGGGDE